MKITREKADEIIKAAFDYSEDIWRDGSHLSFHYIRIYPNGEIYTGSDISESIPESEYFEKEPYPITIRLCSTNNEPAVASEGFEWDECEESEAEYFGDFKTGDYSSKSEYSELSDEEKKKYPTPFKLGGVVDYPDNFDEELENQMKERGIEIED